MHNIGHYIDWSFIFLRHDRINPLLYNTDGFIYDALSHSVSINGRINLCNGIVRLLFIAIMRVTKHDEGIP